MTARLAAVQHQHYHHTRQTYPLLHLSMILEHYDAGE